MAERARILVVDDDESVRRVLKAVLEDSGCSVETARSTWEAVRKSKTKFYNVALIDIRLPDLEGTKLLTRIKDTTPRMRKIVITGYPSCRTLSTP